ncbi:MAG TPA: hypothetical protein VFN35_09915, partial [Ktedonobacteraceae bacterium]|nr:hypothetical protein [Ktedonobacteraceae bacterium]
EPRTKEVTRSTEQSFAQVPRAPARLLSRRNMMIGLGLGVLGTAATLGGLGYVLSRSRSPAPLFFASIYAVAWSPDGKLIASGSSDGIEVKNAVTATPLFSSNDSPKDDSLGWTNVLWSPDSKQILATRGRQLIVLDATTGKKVFPRQIDHFPGSYKSFDWSPDGKQIVLLDQTDGAYTVSLITIATSEEIKLKQGAFSNGYGMHAVTWLPNGKQIALAGTRDNHLAIWTVERATGEEIRIYQGFYVYDIHGVTKVRWSPDGKRVALATYAGTITKEPDGSLKGDHYTYTVQVIDMLTGQEISTYQGHTKQIFLLAWSPDGKRIASGGEDQTLHIWDASTGKQISVSQSYSRTLYAAAWSPDGKQIALGGEHLTLDIKQAP